MALQDQAFWIGCCLFQAISGKQRSLLVLGLVLLLPAVAVLCSLVVDGALIHLIVLKTGELPFFSCTVSFSECDASGTPIKLFWNAFMYSKSGDRFTCHVSSAVLPTARLT